MTSESKSISTSINTQISTVTIRQNNGVVDWDLNNIIPSWNPNFVTVKQISYYSVADAGLWYIRSDMVGGDGVLGSFINQSSVGLSQKYKLNKAGGSSVHFDIRLLAAGDVNAWTPPAGLAALTGDFAMTLEFSSS